MSTIRLAELCTCQFLLETSSNVSSEWILRGISNLTTTDKTGKVTAPVTDTAIPVRSLCIIPTNALDSVLIRSHRINMTARS